MPESAPQSSASIEDAEKLALQTVQGIATAGTSKLIGMGVCYLGASAVLFVAEMARWRGVLTARMDAIKKTASDWKGEPPPAGS